jgi:hypothetical protein
MCTIKLDTYSRMCAKAETSHNGPRIYWDASIVLNRLLIYGILFPYGVLQIPKTYKMTEILHPFHDKIPKLILNRFLHSNNYCHISRCSRLTA